MHVRLIVILLAAAASACATTGGVPRPFPGATTAPTAPIASPAPGAPAAPIAPIAPLAPGHSLATYAMAFRGVPYRLGGADPAGFDCSGLVQYVFAQHGIAVPRVVEDQWEVGKKIKAKDVQPGDLLFFNTKARGRGASHVGIALGPDTFVHAPNSTGVVRIETISSSAYWSRRYLGARRVLPSTTN